MHHRCVRPGHFLLVSPSSVAQPARRWATWRRGSCRPRCAALPRCWRADLSSDAENVLSLVCGTRQDALSLWRWDEELILRRGATVYFTPHVKHGASNSWRRRQLRLDGLLKKLDPLRGHHPGRPGVCAAVGEEMEVLFTFSGGAIRARSVLVKQQSGLLKWDQIFKDPMTTMAAVDRLGITPSFWSSTARACECHAEKERSAS